MHGKLFKEWVSYLKDKRLYSDFILHYVTANRSCKAWERLKPSLKLINGDDCIMPYKGESLSFETFLDKLTLIDWNCSDYYGYWTSVGHEFGKLKGYLQKRDKSNYYNEDSKQASATVYSPRPNPNHRRRRKIRKEYGKWYDAFYDNTIKNRYRR